MYRRSMPSATTRWIAHLSKILQPRSSYFDLAPLRILNPIILEEGILLFYLVQNQLGAALLDKHDETTLLWRTTNPLWQTHEKIHPIKMIYKQRTVVFHYYFKKNYSVELELPQLFNTQIQIQGVVLERAADNPILRANPRHSWEASAVFNAGALYLDNKVHFIYRAITDLGESVFGYAASTDGVHINERSHEPVYYHTHAERYPQEEKQAYCSGPSGHGCEDPRLIRLDDSIYMTYTAFDGTHAPCVALTYIDIDNFLKKQWHWKKPIQLSQQQETHKNWVIFPEKINGQYAILHSLTPKISIHYLDTLTHDDLFIQSHYHAEPALQNTDWDNWIRGVGPPPIKTQEGWLILYHAMEHRDPNKYKIGAMLLALHDPTQVLYRSAYPILEPYVYYENQGHKAGVVYACGAVVIAETLLVYYGAADTVLCAAAVNLERLLCSIKKSQPPITQSLLCKHKHAQPC